MRGMKTFSYLSLIFVSALGAGGALLFQNCQRPVQTLSPASSGEPAAGAVAGDSRPPEPQTFDSQLAAASAPFANGKVQIRKVGGVATEKVRAKAGHVTLPAGQRLVVILDNECARLHPGPLSAKIYNADIAMPELRTQSYKWVLEQAMEIEDVQAAAAGDDCVIGLSQDDILRATALPNDPSLTQQSNFTSIGGGVTFGFFDDNLHGSRSGVVVAVVDSGMNYAHDELKNMLWHNPSSDPNAHNAVGYNFRAANYFPFDDFGHGTFVSGIIAAEANNGIGITGVMGHDLQIMSLKVQSETGEAYISDINTAINYAQAKAVDVINISMEGTGEQAALLSAMSSAVNAGIFIASAAGNSGQLLSSANFVVPANYGAQLEGAMTVGSIDSFTGARSSFSNYSSSLVEIAAPGSNGVYSTTRDGTYGTNQGTSFSAPLIAGAAALTISFFKKNSIAYNAATVEKVLRESALQTSSLAGDFAGGRVLDLRALAQYLRTTYLAPVSGGFDEN